MQSVSLLGKLVCIETDVIKPHILLRLTAQSPESDEPSPDGSGGTALQKEHLEVKVSEAPSWNIQGLTTVSVLQCCEQQHHHHKVSLCHLHHCCSIDPTTHISGTWDSPHLPAQPDSNDPPLL